MQETAILKTSRWAEHSLSIGVLALMTAVPIAELAGRELWGRGVTGSLPLVKHLTFCITFLGAALAVKSERLIAMATPGLFPERLRDGARVFTSALAAAISVWLAYVSLPVVQIEYDAPSVVAWGIPVWAIVALMPLGFTLMAARQLWMASSSNVGRLLALGGVVLAVSIGIMPGLEEWHVLTPALVVLAVATVLGLPIFAALGGAALVLLWADLSPVASVASDIYNLSSSDLLPALPLFSLAGYLLAEGGAGKRLMRAFNAIVGWLPGGLAIVVTLVLAFFTTLGSAVTILSLGGLILPVMIKSGYSEKSAIGLVTVGGSTGLLFPPSLPVILYGIRAGTRIDHLFIGGLIPGALLVLAVAGWGALQGHRAGAPKQPFVWSEAFAAIWAAKWDLLTPILVIVGFLGGRATLVEAAAVTVLYTLFVECIVYRELHIIRDVPRIAVECSAMVGGFLILMGVAFAFMNYMNFAGVPPRILEWVADQHLSKFWFLLALNLFLIVVGAVTDIYSAILVIVPLILPIATKVYGIDEVHLGVIFLTNMELGYLMPPMGENLFLSALRFKKKLSLVYLSTLPYLVLILLVVLLVTYVPALTLAPLGWFK